MIVDNKNNNEIYTRDVNITEKRSKKNRRKLIIKIVLHSLIIIGVAAVTFFLIFTISIAKDILE